MEVIPALTHGDYTVGWVCALPKEQTAAIAMLDQIHDLELPTPPNDQNSYTLGSIGKHNVVIACLPKGKSGTVSAAVVAVQMVNTFPNIKIGLMVGIGGGVPKKQVRLGDVVVSTPTDTFSGVVQWDLGSAENGDAFKRTGALNSPPKSLLTALGKLETEHELHGSKISEYLDELRNKFPRLASSYLKTENFEDVLFKANYSHIAKVPANEDDDYDSDEYEEEEEEESCRLCDKTKTIKRKPRDMKIHYGLIASGNRDIKDAVLRDQINKNLDGNVLCIETEAAGLLDDFPCIIIRGICDYADSHKDSYKNWQEYAAAVAAGFAKELLGCIKASDVEREKPAKELIQTEINRWLSPPDPSINYNEALRRRHKGSGGWFLRCDAFNEWKKRQNSFLWLHGIPGCGKTILSSTIIENLSSHQPLLYFYFDFTDANKQTFEKMIRSLIGQLYYQCAHASPQLDVLFSSCKGGHEQPTCQQLCEIFSRMVEQAKEIWLVLDALDESSEEERKESSMWMRGILASSERWNVHLIMTSRPENDIKNSVMDFSDTSGIVHIQSDSTTDDISAYVRWRIRECDGLKRWRLHPEVQNEIENVVGGKANGM
ncbi:hypothetical protein ABW20_dc0105650 [Dactylellina cionopaga]|nr:hypothetical protein ABW20_dc0105650 [Dactylellina cionopaga]